MEAIRERPMEAIRERLGVAAFIGGVIAGAVIGVTMRVVETSRISFGPYALYGNGALAVPAVVVPLAVFILWAWLLRTKEPGRSVVGAMALAVIGLDLALGISYRLVQGGGFDLGIVASSAVFVLPTAALAAFALLVLRFLLRGSTRALVLLFLGGALLGIVPP